MNSIILIKKSYINNIYFIISYNVDFISLKDIIKKTFIKKIIYDLKGKKYLYYFYILAKSLL